MDKNIFFDIKNLKYIGRNVIIGKTVRIRYPELVSIGDNCIIDDFTYISTELNLIGYNHISAGCKIIGGKNSIVNLDMFSTLSPNVTIAAGSDDYEGGIATPLVPLEFKGKVEYGTVTIGRHAILGSSSVILPNVSIGDGVAIGALSLVKRNLEPWYLYAGIPVRRLKKRNKDQILNLEYRFLNNL
jgi:acetyltransferase-like isoleucine patch superfamily enzyme